MQPFQSNPYDDASPYGEAIPFVDYTSPKETTSVPAGSETPASAASPAAPSLPVAPLQPLSARDKRSAFIASLLVGLVFVVITGSGITWYATVPYPATLHAQATAVVQNILQSQKQATQATASALANSPASLYTSITSSPPNIVDPLNNPNASIWSGSTLGSNLCRFSGQAFHVKVTQHYSDVVCPYSTGNLNNFAFQVQMTLLSGVASGVMFRMQPLNSFFAGYLFYINPSGQYFLYVATKTGAFTQLASGSTLSAKTGLNQTNQITTIALGSTIYLYVNGQFLDKVNDSTLASGLIGLMVFNDTGAKNAGEAVFSNAQIWER